MNAIALYRRVFWLVAQKTIGESEAVRPLTTKGVVWRTVRQTAARETSDAREEVRELHEEGSGCQAELHEESSNCQAGPWTARAANGR
jgi:hypothetical protein